MTENHYYINPLTDFGFKRVFGIDENKDLLIAFLNDCISQQVGVITELTYLNTEHYGLKSSEKKVVFDVLCKNERGEHFIIEMQRGEQTFFARRIVAYVSRLISSEMERGDREYNIPPVYSLNILEFEPPEFAGRDGYFRTVRLKDDDNKIFYKNYALFFIELSKFAAHSRKGESTSGMGKWLHLLKNINNMERQDTHGESEIFQKLFSVCELAQLDDEEKEQYHKSVLEYEDVQDAMRCSHRRGLAEGKAEGLAEGMEKGMEKGLEKGLEKGKAEGKAEIARAMLDDNVEISVIVKFTGMTEEEILKL